MLVSKRPSFSLAEAEALALEHYGLSARAKELPSERDQNFRLSAAAGKTYLLKIAHPDEAQAVLDFQEKALDLLSAPYFPKLCRAKTGKQLVTIASPQGEHCVRLLTYLPGHPIAEGKTLSPTLLEAVGRALGEMDKTLEPFSHPAMHRHLHWDSKHASESIRGNLSYLSDSSKRGLVNYFLDVFETHAAPLLPALRRSVIHNDANDYNLLVAGDRVTGIIDFGDMVHTYTVCELANACAYLLMGKAEPLETIRHVATGYRAVYPLREKELAVLFDFIYLRLCLSVTLSAKQQRQNPDNTYLAISERPAWDLLETLAAASPAKLREQLNTALSK